jgi:lysophospholipase L1-like esterase
VKITIKQKISCIMIGFFLSLLILEILLRILGYGYGLIYNPTQQIGKGYKIFCVGESTTVGIGASNPKVYAYPHQLETMLREKFEDSDIQCFYDTTIGINTSEMLMRLPGYIRGYRPDLIIFMVGTNNYWNLNKSNILLFNKNAALSESSLKVFIFLDNFRAYKLFKWLMYSKGLLKYTADSGFIPEPEDPEEAIRIRRARADELSKAIFKTCRAEIFNEIAEYDISEMLEICRMHKIEAIMCSYPMNGFMNIRAVQERLSRKFDIPFVDNYTIFKSLPSTRDYISLDGWHPNDKGYKLVAENIFDCILEERIIR